MLMRFKIDMLYRDFSALTMKILSMMYKLVSSESYCTKRDIYYQDAAAFGSQSFVDNIVENIACMLQLPRWRLHVVRFSHTVFCKINCTIFHRVPLELENLENGIGKKSGKFVTAKAGER